jgi:hypothetical protein
MQSPEDLFFDGDISVSTPKTPAKSGCNNCFLKVLQTDNQSCE